MKVPGVIVGQRVSEEKKALAKALRREPTEAERVLWEAVRRKKLSGFHFRRQQIIAGFIVDFYCHAAGLVVELDGDIHKSQAEYDAERTRKLEEMGFKVIRFSNECVLSELDIVTEKLTKHLQARTQHDPTPPFPRREGG